MNFPTILWKTVYRHEQTTEIVITIYPSSVFLILQQSQVWLFKLNMTFLTEKCITFPYEILVTELSQTLNKTQNPNELLCFRPCGLGNLTCTYDSGLCNIRRYLNG